MHSNTNPNYAEIRADQVSCLKELLGKRRLSELYHHRERCRKDMLGFLIEYKGDDKSHVHALSRLWLRLLDHTLWNLDNQKNTVFTPDPRLEMSGTIGLCLEWHDFVNFISAVHVLPGYRQWTEEVDDLGVQRLAECVIPTSDSGIGLHPQTHQRRFLQPHRPCHQSLGEDVCRTYPKTSLDRN